MVKDTQDNYHSQIPDMSASLEDRTDYIASTLAKGPSPEYDNLCAVLNDIYAELDDHR